MIKIWAEECQKKFIHPDDLVPTITTLREGGNKIVTLNGSFDLMHAGHLQIIYEASQMGDILIVALNTDASIQLYKNKDRPIIPLKYRLQMMAALEFVGYVTWFQETDPRHILALIQPDVHVNGAEYGPDCIEAETVKTNGGRIHLVEKVDGLSTSQIVSKIRILECAS
jgi:rfaE bifunctional protein nucleotidyltransferase chain/domain